MTKVLVTGGAGLIGSHLVDKLVEEGHSVIIADNLLRGSKKNIEHHSGLVFEIVDLTKPGECESIFACNQDIEEVYHLAAFLGGVEFIRKFPVEAYSLNMKMNMNILECCRIYDNVKKLLFTSTACVYPVYKQLLPDSPPLKEEDALEFEPESGYGWAKLMTEMLCKSYYEEYGLKTGIVRMFNVYGPREAYDDKSHVIPMLSRKALNYPKEKFIVWGNGNQTRSFIYVKDAVEGIIATMKYGINKGPINIGSPNRVTIRELAEKIVALVEQLHNKDIKIEFDTSKPTGVMGRAADITKAKEILNWTPKTSLWEGLAKTILWIEEDMKHG